MIVIGEKLNSSIPSTLEGLNTKNEEFVTDLAARQAAAGAQYLDINTGMCENEQEMLVWTAKLAMDAAPDCRLMPDSTNPAALRFLFEKLAPKNAIINSVTLEEDRLNGVLPIVKEYKTGIVAMPLDADGIPKTAQRRVENARRLIEILRENGVCDTDIYVDIVVEAAATGWDAPKEALLATRLLREEFPAVHLLAGLSNISFGLPKRGVINQAFLACALTEGLDAAIMDITNPAMKLQLFAVEMILGKDEYCMNYLQAFREIEG
ncbi:MAG: dihydropteroate synthase [Christensenella sp.]|nr:dihydropteroate synthase [Christensenella sp.]